MIDAMLAETLKLKRHRATWLMVWIYPLALALVTAFLIVRGFTLPDGAATQAGSAAQWIAGTAMIWSVPQSGIGRYLMAGFCAVVFASEYGWNTWKLVIPARPRWQLIAAKWAAATAFLYAAFLSSDLIMLFGEWLRAALGQTAIPDSVSIAALARTQLTEAMQAVFPIVYTVAAAALLAVVTRSVLATVILSIVLITIEQLLPGIAMLLGGYFATTTKLLAEALPFYHVGNVLTWFKTGDTLKMLIGAATPFHTSWHTSLAVALGWIAAAGATTLYLFARQDQN